MFMLLRKAGRWIRRYPCTPLRRARSRGSLRWIDRLPSDLLNRLDLVAETVEPLRIELGGGPHPTPGYVHVDLDRSARHLEHIAPVWRLPFPDGSVKEVLAIHVLEHVHPSMLNRTLREWRRVLAPDGSALIHVPNAPSIFKAYISGSLPEKWALVNALFGMYGGADINGPEDISANHRSDHQAMFDFPLLAHEIRRAGFGSVTDLTGQVSDRHCEAWSGLVDNYSLIVRAEKVGG